MLKSQRSKYVCACRVTTYSCQTSEDMNEHPWGSLQGAWDILLSPWAWRHSQRTAWRKENQHRAKTGICWRGAQLNQILLQVQIRKHVQIALDTVQPQIIFPSPTWYALRAPSCRCLFLDSLVKNSMSGHPWRTNLPSISHLAHLWQQYGLRLYLPSPIASKHTKVNVLRSPLQMPRVSASWFCCQEAFIYLLVCWRLLKYHRLF